MHMHGLSICGCRSAVIVMIGGQTREFALNKMNEGGCSSLQLWMRLIASTHWDNDLLQWRWKGICSRVFISVMRPSRCRLSSVTPVNTAISYKSWSKFIRPWRQCPHDICVQAHRKGKSHLPGWGHNEPIWHSLRCMVECNYKQTVDHVWSRYICNN